MQKPPPVLTKHDFVKRYKAGEFGNHAPTWNALEEYQNAGYKGMVHLRNRQASGTTIYNVPDYRVKENWDAMLKAGILPSDIYISAMAPHEKNVIQGEVFQSTRHYTLFYSRQVGLPMRDALQKDGNQVHGIMVLTMLRECLDVRSMLWLEDLLQNYPGHVVEFSTFSEQWGTLPGFNTCFWEVRNY